MGQEVQHDSHSEKRLGTVRIAPNVLATIIYAAASAVPGVLKLGETPSNEGGISRIFNRDGIKGVKIEVRDGAVSADLYIIVSRDINMVQVGKQVQTEVSKAVRNMVGMQVEQINVFIQNVE